MTVVTPLLPESSGPAVLQELLDKYTEGLSAAAVVKWYYTPMMLAFSRHLEAVCTVYDCMDELANFRFAPPGLLELETELLALANVVFTGGYSLYEAKRHMHRNVHAFPSSVDKTHFEEARRPAEALDDYRNMKGPKLGFFGVIDERMDLDLLLRLATSKPDWHIVMLGPLAKLSSQDLPAAPNLHFIGGRGYDELPAHLANWDVALMPFAICEATRFISPTKTPEYLAGGKPVVSTPIKDVIRHYSKVKGVYIASAENFVAACEDALALSQAGAEWLSQADEALADLSWDRTASEMLQLVSDSSELGSRMRSMRPLAVSTTSASRPPRQASSKPYDYLIVGAGFAGSVLAERLASQLNKRVLLIDRRSHIAGNAFDFHDASGVLMHRYGPHIFHTNSLDIFEYLSRFTTWRPYEHRVRAVVDGKRVPMPINRTTLNMLYGLDLQSDDQAAAYLAGRAEPVSKIQTSEDVVINAVGRDLYEKFFRGYTRKQWGLEPSQLHKSVTARVPTRTSLDDRYFDDKYQYMPAHGYTRMFEKMLDDERITVELGVDFADLCEKALYDRLVFTGPIDEYFDYQFGKLPYRSLRFRHLSLDQERFQEVATINYPSEQTPFTRVSEYKHMTGQKTRRTTITFEYPTAEGDPYYPVPRAENQTLYKLYEALALAQSAVVFCGRLATYQYLNMDQVVGQALATFRRIADHERKERTRATELHPAKIAGTVPVTHTVNTRSVPASR